MELSAILALVRVAIKDGPAILSAGSDLYSAARPVLPVLEQQAPALGAAIKKLADLIVPAHGAPTGHPDSAAEAIAKAIVIPHAVSDTEKNWMDRASFSTGQ